MNKPVMVSIENNIAVVVLNRAEAFNAFDLGLVEFFAETLLNLGGNPQIRGIVISGQGKAFCAGGDLKWALSFKDGVSAAFYNLAAQFHLAVSEIKRMAKPVIAAINGVAAGGGFSLALACDFRVMEKSAVLRQAYTSSGLCIDGGGTFSLPRLVGLARAMEIAAFDRPISADQALAWGLVTKVVEEGTAVQEAVVLAEELSLRSLNAFRISKQLLTDSFDTAFETQLDRERRALCACAEHEDGKEGLKAFIDKRRPQYGCKQKS